MMIKSKKLMTLAIAIILSISCLVFPASAINCSNEQISEDTNAVTRNAEYLRVKSGYSTEIYDTSAVTPQYKWLHSGNEMYVSKYYKDKLDYWWVYGRVTKGELSGKYGWVIIDESRVSIIQS